MFGEICERVDDVEAARFTNRYGRDVLKDAEKISRLYSELWTKALENLDSIHLGGATSMATIKRKSTVDSALLNIENAKKLLERIKLLQERGTLYKYFFTFYN